jgi:TonB family protein
MTSYKKILFFLLLSLCTHLVLLLFFYFLNQSLIKPENAVVSKKPLEVTIIEKTPSKEKETLSQNKNLSFIKDLPVPEELLEKKVSLQKDFSIFNSAKQQRVKKQTQASNFGPTVNSVQKNFNPQQTFEPQQDPSQKETLFDRKSEKYLVESSLIPKSENHLNLQNQKKNLKKHKESHSSYKLEPLKSSFSPRESSLGTKLPNNIEIGSLTVLNTDQFTYYSFFERIENQVRFRWEQELFSTIKSMDPKELRQYPRKGALTVLEVVLDETGSVENIFLLGSSGLKPFDTAAAQAFIKAKQFMNPPIHLVDSDKKIRLQYQLLVYLH